MPTKPFEGDPNPSLSSHRQYNAKDIAPQFSTPNIGLELSALLSRLSCTFLAREYELMT